MVNGTASSLDMQRHSEHWLRSLVDLLERGGIGQLERKSSGEVAFRFADQLPTAEEAWARAWAASEPSPAS